MKALLSSLMDIDFTKIVPEIGAFVGWVKFFLIVAMLIGPVVMLITGAVWVWRPSKEPTYRRGYQHKCIMENTENWLYAQRFAGLIRTVLGGAMTVVAGIVALITALISETALATAAVIFLLVEIILVVIATIYIDSTVKKHCAE